MSDEMVDIFKEETQAENVVVKENKSRFKCTIGRCFDIVILSVNITNILVTLAALVCLAVVIANSASAAAEVGLSSNQACLLFATGNNSLIRFTSSTVCYYILATPLVIWCFSALFIIFLLLKIWRKWNLGFIEVVLFIASLVCLLYSTIAAIVLTAGHMITCKNVAELDVPLSNPSKKQSCYAGGAYYNIDSDNNLKFIQFEGYFFVAEIAIWISSVILVALSLLHCMRIIIFWRRRSKRADLVKTAEV